MASQYSEELLLYQQKYYDSEKRPEVYYEYDFKLSEQIKQQPILLTSKFYLFFLVSGRRVSDKRRQNTSDGGVFNGMEEVFIMFV